MLLQPEHLDPQIWVELNADSAEAEICPINSSGLNFIDELLQANRTAPSLQEHREKAKNITGPWSLENGLLKHQERLVVAEE